VTPTNPKMAIETTRELFNTLVKAGVQKDVLERESGIGLAILEKAESRYPVKSHLQLWNAGDTLLKNEDIGIQMGSVSNPYNRGIVGLNFAASPDLEVAIINKIRFTKILADHINLEFYKTSTSFSVHYSILEGYFHRLEIERVFSGFLNWVRTFVNSKIYPTRLSFQYSSPESIDLYTKHFRCPMVFDEAVNSITFDIKLLASQNNQFNEYLYSILQSRAEDILSKLGCYPSFVKDVQSMIAGRLCNGNFLVEDIAASLNMSKRTFHRRLADENVTYQGLLDDVRKEMTVSYLAKDECSVKNVPFLVGYADARSFNRAFKRWFGNSVNQYLQSAAV